MSIVRNNLLSDPNYAPYCMGNNCRVMDRLVFTGKQFQCRSCGYITEFDADFIQQLIAFRAKSEPHQITQG